MTFREKVLLTSEKYNLINKNDNILVALSGGADSVSLLLSLLEIKDEYNLNIEAAHINHMIREEAENDEMFSLELCKKYNVKFHHKKINIPLIAREKSLSEENAGRISRYEFFENVIDGRDFKIATAHNKDDSAENFLIGALRGTNPKGIPPKRGNIIRPIIEITKKEIYEYLKEKNQGFCEDKTNFTTDYTRNKVRIELIPYINEKFDTSFTNAVYNSLDVSYFENNFLEEETKRIYSDIVKENSGKKIININEFEKLHLALRRRLIKEIYYSFDNKRYISFEHIESVLELIKNKSTGKKIELCGDIEAVCSYDNIIFGKKEKNNTKFEYKANINEKLYIPELKKSVFINTEGKGTAFYSGELSFTMRSRKDGDQVYIKNVGHKKLKSLFIDKKIDRSIRNNLIIIEVKNGISYVENVYSAKKDEQNINKIYVYIED